MCGAKTKFGAKREGATKPAQRRRALKKAGDNCNSSNFLLTLVDRRFVVAQQVSFGGVASGFRRWKKRQFGEFHAKAQLFATQLAFRHLRRLQAPVSRIALRNARRPENSLRLEGSAFCKSRKCAQVKSAKIESVGCGRSRKLNRQSISAQSMPQAAA